MFSNGDDFFSFFRFFSMFHCLLCVCIFCAQIEVAESWEESIDEIVAGFENKHRRKLLYSVSFY